ncbi:MAG TPA: hypothetical protein VH639_08845 [Bryobacteraceae bacterium]|jgi:hypothetical protein
MFPNQRMSNINFDLALEPLRHLAHLFESHARAARWPLRNPGIHPLADVNGSAGGEWHFATLECIKHFFLGAGFTFRYQYGCPVD